MNENIKSNLLRLRVSNDMTQSSVAEKIGISLLAYRNIESGESIPSTPTIEKLANLFNVNPGVFWETPENTVKAVRFRALSEDKNIRKREEIIYTVANWLKEFNNLLLLLKQENKYTYQLSSLVGTTTDPIKMSELVREKMEISLEEPIRDICSLIESRAGIKIYAKEFFSDSFFGLSLLDNKNDRAIVVNTWNKISVERRKFTVAHELGHILLHEKSFQENITDENEQEEAEANCFASYFLMPYKSFIDEWCKYDNCDFIDKVIKIKQTFGVSYQVVLYRLSEIIKGMKKESQFNVWNAFREEYRKKYGVTLGKKDEMLPMNENIKELQSLSSTFYYGRGIADLVKQAFFQNIIDKKECARILKLSLEELDNIINSWKFDSLIQNLNNEI